MVGAALSGRVAVVGGLTADGAASARVDLYDPRRERWLRLPDLPEGLHHAMAASRAGRLYVVGGYRIRDGAWEATDRAWVLFDRRWRALPRLPEARAAGARRSCATGSTWSAGPRRRRPEASPAPPSTSTCGPCAGGPSPPCRGRASTWASRRWAAASTRSAGRTAGLETNTAAADAYDPRARTWSRLPDAPTRRGGNAATTAGGLAVAVGGEGPNGTIRQVDAYDPATGAWRSLPRSPQPRHGVAVVGIGRTVYQALGGPKPGLFVSPTLLSLRVPTPG